MRAFIQLGQEADWLQDVNWRLVLPIFSPLSSFSHCFCSYYLHIPALWNREGCRFSPPVLRWPPRSEKCARRRFAMSLHRKQTTDWKIRGTWLIPRLNKDFSLHHCVKIDSGAHSTSYQVGTVGSFLTVRKCLYRSIERKDFVLL
jgi:hypothetical protein